MDALAWTILAFAGLLIAVWLVLVVVGLNLMNGSEKGERQRENR